MENVKREKNLLREGEFNKKNQQNNSENQKND